MSPIFPARVILLGLLTVAAVRAEQSQDVNKPQWLLSVPTRLRLVNINMDGRIDANSPRMPERGMEPNWTRDGKRLAFVQLIQGKSDILVLDTATGTTTNLTHNRHDDRLPAWSPDGSKIAFMSDRLGDNEVFVMNADGTDVQNVTNHPGYDGDPAWTPDGKHIVFASRRGGVNFPLYIMNSDGTEPREFFSANIGGWVFPDWSPDGKQLAFGGRHADGTVQLMVLDVATKSPSVLTTEGVINSFPRWSPDGRFIAYVHIAEFGYDPLGVGADLIIYDVEDKKHRKLGEADLPYWGPRPAWVPTAAAELTQETDSK